MLGGEFVDHRQGLRVRYHRPQFGRHRGYRFLLPMEGIPVFLKRGVLKPTQQQVLPLLHLLFD